MKIALSLPVAAALPGAAPLAAAQAAPLSAMPLATPSAAPMVVASPGYWGTVWLQLRRDPVSMAAAALLLLLVLAALLAPWLAPPIPTKPA